jgi:putative SOS response-associated peptidase YedK
LPATFNARSDGVATKPMFREAFKGDAASCRCRAFYEWRQMEDGRQPFFISDADGGCSPALRCGMIGRTA